MCLNVANLAKAEKEWGRYKYIKQNETSEQILGIQNHIMINN